LPGEIGFLLGFLPNLGIECSEGFIEEKDLGFLGTGTELG
jgi:hypothetical protein